VPDEAELAAVFEGNPQQTVPSLMEPFRDKVTACVADGIVDTTSIAAWCATLVLPTAIRSLLLTHLTNSYMLL